MAGNMRNVLMCCVLLVSACSSFTTKPMRQMVYRAPLPAESTPAKLTECLKKAITKSEGWSLTQQSPDVHIGELRVRSHMVRVQFNVLRDGITVDYVDSADMKYDGEHIHRKYFTWIEDKLFNDIRRCQ